MTSDYYHYLVFQWKYFLSIIFFKPESLMQILVIMKPLDLNTFILPFYTEAEMVRSCEARKPYTSNGNCAVCRRPSCFVLRWRQQMCSADRVDSQCLITDGNSSSDRSQSCCLGAKWPLDLNQIDWLAFLFVRFIFFLHISIVVTMTFQVKNTHSYTPRPSQIIYVKSPKIPPIAILRVLPEFDQVILI